MICGIDFFPPCDTMTEKDQRRTTPRTSVGGLLLLTLHATGDNPHADNDVCLEHRPGEPVELVFYFVPIQLFSRSVALGGDAALPEVSQWDTVKHRSESKFDPNLEVWSRILLSKLQDAPGFMKIRDG